MKIPQVYHSECPSCGHWSGVRLTDAGEYWVAGTCWECPYCKGVFSVEQWAKKAKDCEHDEEDDE